MAIESFRISEAGRLLGVSDDTIRRWVEAGRLSADQPSRGPVTIGGAELARFAVGQAASEPELPGISHASSARNRFTGLVTRVLCDTVMAQVEIQAGRFRVVSLMSREAVDELGLVPGVLAVASIKATNVVVELPG